MTRLTYRAALLLATAAAALAPLRAQTEVPAIINTYRANPLQATALSRSNGTASFSLTAEQVREWTYRCYIAGTMQGTPDATGTFGMNSAAQPYPVVAPQLTASERLPAMPLVRRAGVDGLYGTVDDELILFVELRKLPLQATCEKVVENLRELGLASKLDAAKPMSFDASATGNWRILIHPPRGKGAPPAPGVYYPEALGAVTPGMTKAQADGAFATAPNVNVFREFWARRAAGGTPTNTLEFRYCGWGDWVRNAWVGGAQPCHVPAAVVNGAIPMPFLVKDPNFARIAEAAGGVNRDATLPPGQADRDICRGTMFFDPNSMWENRRLDADGSIKDPAADLTNAAAWVDRRPSELPGVDSPADRPIEVLFRFAPAADPDADKWFLRGIHTTSENTEGSVDPTLVLPTAGTLNTPNGFAYYPATNVAPVIEVNLLDGRYRAAGSATWLGTAVSRPVYAGVGMVEMQFEYETGVPVETTGGALTWSGTVSDAANPAFNGGPWPFGWNNQPGGADDAAAVALWDLDGPDNVKGNADDQVLFAADLAAHAPPKQHVVDARTAGATYARDPLNVRRAGPNWDPAALANAWRIRRFCSWPHNAGILGVTGNYQGGPLVCRYMVSSVQVLPQDADVASSANPALSQMAQYDPANGRLYPQIKTLVASGNPRDETQDLERANFLLGYLADGGVLSPVSDYFLPVNPGAKSPTLRFYVQTMLDNTVGGGNYLWTEGVPAASGLFDGMFQGPRDVRKGVPDDYLGYDFTALSPTATSQSALLYWYDIRRTHNAAGTQTETADTKVRYDDDLTASATVLDPRRAFDGDAATNTTVRDDRWLGRVFDVPSLVDRVDLTINGAANAADFELQYYDTVAATWTTFGSLALEGGLLSSDGPRDACGGIRVRNISGSDRLITELRIVTMADLRSQVAQPPAVVTGRAAPDANIANASVPASAVKVSGALDRELSVRHDTVTPLDLSVEIPRFQPPSRDAVERQIDADRGLTPAYDTMVDPRGDWDRYRGSVRVYVDDQRTYVRDLRSLEAPTEPASQLKRRAWDASLYQLRSGSTQFVRWYDEYSGAVGAQQEPNSLRYIADLTTDAGGYQHVGVESYAPFDVEFTVGYERRMSIAERFVDFGKAIGGGMSQWVPLTITNEGNVPLYDVKFYVQAPMRAVQVSDGASRARGIQLNPIPSWLSTNLAVGAPTERGLIQMYGGGTLSAVFPAAPGALAGNTVTNVFMRLGRNDLATPLRIPVGQPMGNYAGSLAAFVDNLGTQAADCPNDGSNSPDRDAKTAVGGSAVMKATIGESPLARVSDFLDNEVNRGRESANVLNVAPYDATRAQPGTFQPVPDFEFYSDPDVADATPALAVAQDLTTMTNAQPNQTDQLAVFWSRLIDPLGGANPRWDVWLQRATRPTLAANQVTSTNYRAFQWPAAPLAGNPQGAAPAGTRNVYPNVCAIPGSTGPDYLVLWHNEADKPAENRRASALQFYRYSGTNRGPLLTVADDASGNGLVNKAMPRAVVDTMAGAGLVLWCAWQDGQAGRAKLGFNAINMPAGYAAAAGYTDAIMLPAGAPVRNYELHTPPGLTNMAEPWLLPSYRDEVTNVAPVGADPRVGNLRLLNGFYSAWSPLWQNQDIYWTRYRALQDPAESATDNVNTWAEGLNNSPMSESAFRLARTATAGAVTIDFPTTGQTQTLTSLPGGRVPFPRITDELLEAMPENTTFGSAHPDWVMPPAQPRLSYCAAASPGVRRVEQVNHKGFADTVLPITDHDAAGNAVPLVQLRIFPATSLTAGPPDLSTNPALLSVSFDLTTAIWDAAQGEWVMTIRNAGGAGDAYATLNARGVKAVRIHPGLGRVTFSAPLYKRGQNNPIYVYASYRPATWRMTDDLAGDSQPTAAFDWWERLTLVWRRGLENGRGQLWYRTFSLTVPLSKPPLTAAPSAMADLDATPQAITPTLTADDLRDGMVHVPIDRAGHRLQFTYTYTIDTGTATATDERHYVPGLGPERIVPMDGLGSESMPALAAEHFLAGYPLGTPTQQRTIMSGRHWLAWVSTRDLYRLNATAGSPPVRGRAGTHVYYGAFLPDYTPAAEAR